MLKIIIKAPLKVYFYIFYRIYSLAIKAKVMDPELTAIIALTIIGIINSLSASRIYQSLHYSEITDQHRYSFYAFSAILFIVNCVIFYSQKRYIKILEAFQNESKRVRIASSVLVILLAVFTLVFFIYVVETFQIPVPSGYKHSY